jgi:hypothetical protein
MRASVDARQLLIAVAIAGAQELLRALLRAAQQRR